METSKKALHELAGGIAAQVMSSASFAQATSRVAATLQTVIKAEQKHDEKLTQERDAALARAEKAEKESALRWDFMVWQSGLVARYRTDAENVEQQNAALRSLVADMLPLIDTLRGAIFFDQLHEDKTINEIKERAQQLLDKGDQSNV